MASQKEFGGDLPDGAIHVVGDGKDRRAIENRFRQLKVPSVFHGRVDHADELCRDFRVLVNPSKTEVLCTTVAEALAMGKWVLIARHPERVFYDFPTCLSFDTKRNLQKNSRTRCATSRSIIPEGAAAAVLGGSYRAFL